MVCLVLPLWRPSGPWGDPGAPGATRKDTWISRAHFDRFSGAVEETDVFFMVVSRLLSPILGLNPFFRILSGLGTNCHDFCCPED